jgi:hypothetical protein
MIADQVNTANIHPSPYFREGGIAFGKFAIIGLLAVFVVGGFWLRSAGLSAESLGEDEWKKLQTVEDYRANGLTGANGEHPLLLKGMLTISVSAAERWNATSFAQGSESLQIPVETALRFPVTLLGALCAVLIFLIAAELFGIEVGLIAAALWAFDPSGISFSRIAKEDVVMTFFFMLANVFFLRGQRAAENGETNHIKWLWFTAVAYGAMLATKYFPHFLAISAAYYYTFQGLPSTRWRIGKMRWFIFLMIVGVSFLLFNPTILLPDTWRAITSFVSENRVGYKVESSYEYMGQIYRNKLTLWLFGIPWHFFYVFILVKLPLTTLAGLFAGLALMFRRYLGDGRYFIFWWCFFWFMPFSVLGGKFTRYLVFVLPAIMMISAIGISWFSRKVSDAASRNGTASTNTRNALFAVVFSVAALVPFVESVRVMPFYRLYTNALGGGMANAGTYFPHDEFFDARLGESAKFIAAHAPTNARVFSETPQLMEFHLRRAGRDDLVSVWLSDPNELREMRPGDVVIDARGRRYLSNDAMLKRLEEISEPAASINLGDISAVKVFLIDEAALAAVRQE